MSGRWVGGNRFSLLENGEAYYPRVFEAIAAAREEVYIETFILFDDKVGQQLHAAMLAAARRGATVNLLVDGFGSPDLPPSFTQPLADAGVRLQVFDPAPSILGWRPNMLRRMHRKIVVIDGTLAFVGGINYSADHLKDFGPEAKQDYAVEIEGPIVGHIHAFTKAAARVVQPSRRWLRRRLPAAAKDLPAAGDAQAIFITRDNRDHRTDIERHYRAAIRSARERVVIANAYFFPGYRFIRELRRAARRGVEVVLILQGEPDMPIAKAAASTLYAHLLKAGVRIFEYCERPLHGKVALVDDEWSTVGSSNLDPLSLSLNLEANVVIRDGSFNAVLRERLQYLMDNACKEIDATQIDPPGLWSMARSYFVFHFLRHFPRWAPMLPQLTRPAVAAQRL
ncbi:cardiolipin synthase ClsB [Aquincola sp. MAHUQ-54]|uniref:Cardiolipin synthase B n=1 Tax=Aquincola agrisoli TaxID=3119538 RepID=A0AAW9QGY4_9BURK